MNDKTKRLLLQATKIMDIEQLELVRDLAKVTRINALEEAAKVAEGMWWQGHGNLATAPYAAAEQAGDEIAAAIRALKEKP